MDDRALVARIINGDAQAFQQLIRQNERLVAHMVGRLVKETEDREELCQDVFMKVFEKVSNFSFQSKLSTWIATIAYRTAINHLRKSKVRFVDIEEEEKQISRLMTDDNPGELLDEKDIEQHVMSLIEQLPPHYKVVLTLFHVDGKNYEEIGEITGMPDGTVKNYLFRARQILKEKVKSYLREEEWK
jgi:RNA polymerase sigma-70 factor (ECF subfamily)